MENAFSCDDLKLVVLKVVGDELLYIERRRRKKDDDELCLSGAQVGWLYSYWDNIYRC